MMVNRFASYARHGGWAATLGLILVAGCETTRTPLELARPSIQPAPPHVASVVSVAGVARDQAWVRGHTHALNEASHRIQAAPERR
ncbi:MAG TPA: hypothetical protein VF142_19765, partial [Longimicrobium sp.]